MRIRALEVLGVFHHCGGEKTRKGIACTHVGEKGRAARSML